MSKTENFSKIGKAPEDQLVNLVNLSIRALEEMGGSEVVDYSEVIGFVQTALVSLEMRKNLEPTTKFTTRQNILGLGCQACQSGVQSGDKLATVMFQSYLTAMSSERVAK